MKAADKLRMLDKIIARDNLSNKIVGSSKIGIFVAMGIFFINPYVSIIMQVMCIAMVVGATGMIKKNIRELKRL